MGIKRKGLDLLLSRSPVSLSFSISLSTSNIMSADSSILKLLRIFLLIGFCGMNGGVGLFVSALLILTSTSNVPLTRDFIIADRFAKFCSPQPVLNLHTYFRFQVYHFFTGGVSYAEPPLNYNICIRRHIQKSNANISFF